MLVECKDVQYNGILVCTWTFKWVCAAAMQVFAKADPRVAQFYETGLVPKEPVGLWRGPAQEVPCHQERAAQGAALFA